MFFPYSNSRNNGNGIPDDDSGQGSSLDRDYGIYNNEPRYANPPAPVPPPTYYSMDHNGHAGQLNGHAGQHNGHAGQHNGHAGQHNGSAAAAAAASNEQLDLTNNREYRGSAFELYKKPMHLTATNSPNPQQYQNNSVW